MQYREYYRRRLPHWQPRDAILFVTFRLAGTLPAQVDQSILTERQCGEPVACRLTGPAWLGQPAIAAVVEAAIRWRHGRVHRLHAYCIMPNHVHLLIEPLAAEAANTTSPSDPPSLAGIMHSLKRRTAREANSLLGRNGPFWAREYYDHCVRDEDELCAIVEYVRWNPVVAGVVDNPEDWPWTAVFAAD